MTEVDWSDRADPKLMLGSLRGPIGGRKILLFMCACGRRLSELLTDDRSLGAIRTVERFADARASRSEVQEALEEAEAAMDRFADADDVDPHAIAATVAHDVAWAVGQDLKVDFFAGLAESAAEAVATASAESLPDGTHDDWIEARRGEAAAQARLLREIFGNPFHPVTIDPAWRTPEVVSLAQAIHDGQAFGRMSELADALERAGCTDARLLTHCRESGEHVRGCWVVDVLLGKQ